LRTEYADRLFSPQTTREDLFRYQAWLPVTRMPEGTGRSAVYRSTGVGKALGLSNLWIAFNGYWPERGIFLETATFKEFEAYTVLGRIPEREMILTVASSGNTGAAFASACSRWSVPCLLIIPLSGLRRMRFREPLHSCVTVVVIDDGDYPDAMVLAAALSRLPPFQAEGGAKNVGRRDGLATVMLSAIEEMGCLPEFYFQAVGSGTGAIAALEAARRVCYASPETRLPKLMMCQNKPFSLIHDSWRMNQRSLSKGPEKLHRDAIKKSCADELTNWTPPYAITGGVYDALTQSGGDVLVADNAAVHAAMKMFLALEGIDIEPAVGVAVACLRESVTRGMVDRESVILLNVTGGGRNRLSADHPLREVRPRLHLTRDSMSGEAAVREITELCLANMLVTPR
jgi:cysteate synthase